MSKTLDLSIELIKRPSITPHDGGCQDLLAARLEKIGFVIERFKFGEVENLWARHGKDSPLLAFVGHTDVVPTGPIDQWHSPPFEPTIKDGFLYGRGAADMKTGIAAMVTAVEEFLQKNPQPKGSIAFLITSDEEGPSVDGTVKVIEVLESRKEKIDWCLVGEPSSVSTLGDTIKNGRRGSLGAKLTVHGIQGHVAYPDKALNPIHAVMPALIELCGTSWDNGNSFFPATSFQISNINSGTGAENVIPGDLEALFNFRFSTESTAAQLQARVETILKKHGLKYDLDWALSGQPFLTKPGKLVQATLAAIKSEIGIDSILSTIGGTSDGRFVAPTGAQVVELGLLNATIHKINECVSVADLDLLHKTYLKILENLFVN